MAYGLQEDDDPLYQTSQQARRGLPVYGGSSTPPPAPPRMAIPTDPVNPQPTGATPPVDPMVARYGEPIFATPSATPSTPARREVSPDFAARYGEPIFAGQAAPKDDSRSHFGRGLQIGGWEQNKQFGASLVAYGADAFGLEGLKDWGMEKYKAVGKDIEGLSRDNDDIFVALSDKGSFTDWLGYAAGNVVGNAASFLTGAGVGGVVGKALLKKPLQAMVGGMIEKKATELAAKELIAGGLSAEAAAQQAAQMAGRNAISEATKLKAAEYTAQLVGATAASYGLNLGATAGSIYGGAEERYQAGEGPKPELGRIGAAAAGSAGLDTLVDMTAIGRVLRGAGHGSNVVGRVIKGGLAQGFLDGGTEGLQGVAERWGAQQTLADAEAIRSYLNEAAVGAVGGVGAGAVAGARGRNAAEQERYLKGDPNATVESLPEREMPAITPGERRGLQPPGGDPVGAADDLAERISVLTRQGDLPAVQTGLKELVGNAQAALDSIGARPAIYATLGRVQADLDALADRHAPKATAQGLQPPVAAPADVAATGAPPVTAAPATAANAPVVDERQAEAAFTMPEPSSDINAQIAAMTDPKHPKDTVYIAGIRSGTPIPAIPKGVSKIFKGGDGLYLTTNPDKAKAILNIHGPLTDKQRASLLGIPQSKLEVASQIGPKVAVTAKDAAGNVVMQAATTPGGPNVKAVQDQTPVDGTTEITPITEVLEERAAKVDAELAPTITETPVVTETTEPPAATDAKKTSKAKAAKVAPKLPAPPVTEQKPAPKATAEKAPVEGETPVSHLRVGNWISVGGSKFVRVTKVGKGKGGRVRLTVAHGDREVDGDYDPTATVLLKDDAPAAKKAKEVSKAKEAKDAVPKQGAAEVLQRESEEAGKAGRKRGRVEQGEQGKEAAAKDEGKAEALEPDLSFDGIDGNGEPATLHVWLKNGKFQRIEQHYEDGTVIRIAVRRDDTINSILDKIADDFRTHESIKEEADAAAEEAAKEPTEEKKEPKQRTADEALKVLRKKIRRKGRTATERTVPEGASRDEREVLVNEYLAPEFGNKHSVTLVDTPDKYKNFSLVIHKLLDQNVQFYTPANQRVDAMDGFKLPGDPDTIYVNANAKKPEMFVIGHEIGHNIRELNPALWSKFMDEVDKIADRKMFATYQHNLKLRMEAEAKARDETRPSLEDIGDQTRDEVSADAMGTAFMDEEFWKMLHDSVDVEQRPLVVRMMEEFVAMLARWKQALAEALKLADPNVKKKPRSVEETRMFKDLRVLNRRVRDLIVEHRQLEKLTKAQVREKAAWFYDEKMEPDEADGEFPWVKLSEDVQDYWADAYDMYRRRDITYPELERVFGQVNASEAKNRRGEAASGQVRRSEAYQTAKQIWDEKIATKKSDPDFDDLIGDHKNHFIRAVADEEGIVEAYDQINEWRAEGEKGFTEEQKRLALIERERVKEEKVKAKEQAKVDAAKAKVKEKRERLEALVKAERPAIAQRLQNLTPAQQDVVGRHFKTEWGEKAEERLRKLVDRVLDDPETLSKLPDPMRRIIKPLLGGIKFSRAEFGMGYIGPVDEYGNPEVDTAERQTDTAAFKDWFKDSKVVTPTGRPMTVYHHGSFASDPDNYTPSGPMHFGTFQAAQERATGKQIDDAVDGVTAYKRDGRWYWKMNDGTTSEDVTDESWHAEERAVLAGRGTARQFAESANAESDMEDLGTLTATYLSLQNPMRVRDMGDNANWKEVIDLAKQSGHDGIVYKNKYEDAGKDSYIAFEPGQIKSATENVGTFDPRNPDIRYSRKGLAKTTGSQAKALRAAERFLTEAEAKKLYLKDGSMAQIAFNFLRTLQHVPSAQEMAAVAHAGRAKRDWYTGSVAALHQVFGIDAPRFAALLSSMSPRVSVQDNLRNSLAVWRDWDKAGRPTDAKTIKQILRGAIRVPPMETRETDDLRDIAKMFGINPRKGHDTLVAELSALEKRSKVARARIADLSVLPALVNNSIRSLTAEDPGSMISLLSGPKVNSFFRNLIGDASEVTNDAWMAAYAAVEQEIFGGKLTGLDSGKGHGYLAMNSRTREAARILTKRTGVEWTPAEVQTTIWAWAKTLYQLQERTGESRDAMELLNDGALTDDLIAANVDFRNLFTDETKPYQGLLREAGLGNRIKGLYGLGAGHNAPAEGDQANQGTAGQAGPFVERTQRRYERQAARRLAERYADRLNRETATRALSRSSGRRAQVKFSRKDLLNPQEIYATKGDKIVGMATYNAPNQRWFIYKAVTPDGDIRDDYSEHNAATSVEAINMLRERGVRLERRKASALEEGFNDAWPRGPDALYDHDTSPQPGQNWFTRNVDRALDATGLFNKKGKELRRNLQRRAQDANIDVRSLQEDIVRKGGVISAASNVYQKITLFAGKVGEQMERFQRKYAEPMEEQIGKAMKKGATMNDIDTFLIAQHAEERNEQIEQRTQDRDGGPITDGSGMSTDEANRTLRTYASVPYAAELNEIGRIADEISEDKVSRMEKAGLIDADTAAGLRKYQHYRPLKGLDDDDTTEITSGLGVGRGFSGKASLLKYAMGRETQAKHVVSHLLLDAEAKIVRAGKNEVALSLANLAADFPDPKFWTLNPMKARRTFDPEKGTIRYTNDNDLTNPNVVTAYQNGIPTKIDLHQEDFANAITGASATGDGVILDKARKFNKFLASMMTTLNPEWALINAARDVQTAFYNIAADKNKPNMPPGMEKTVLKQILALKGHKDIYKAITDPNHQAGLGQWYHDLAEQGGITKFFALESLKDRAEKLKAMEQRLTGTGIKGKALDAYKKSHAEGAVKWLEDVNSSIEAAPRVIAYKVLVEAGWTKANAADYVKNLTTNFQRKGTSSELTSLFLFFNPAVQGTARIYQAMRSPQGKAIAAGLFGMGFVAGLTGNAGGDDDENGIPDYQQLSDWDRSTNIIPFAHGPKLPLPYGWNAFYAMGNFAADAFFGRSPVGSAFAGLKAAHSAFDPIGGADSKTLAGWLAKTVAPTAVDPFIEFGMNENRFGSRIYREQSSAYGAKQPESQTGSMSASATSRAIASGLNSLTQGSAAKAGGIDVSPDSIDFWAGTALPGIPTVLGRGLSTLKKIATGEATETKEYPVVRRVLAEPSKGKVYEALQDAKAEINEFQNIAKNGTPEERRELAKEHPGWAGIDATFKAMTKQTGELYKRKAAIIDGKLKVDDEATEKNRIDKKIEELNNRMLKSYTVTVAKW